METGSPISNAIMPREMGFWSGASLIAASMIGVGILITPGYTAAVVGSHGLALGMWVLGGLMALCGAVTLAEMTTSLPKAGGEYIFVHRAWGPLAGFVYGWATLIVGFAGPTAAVCLTAIEYGLHSLPEHISLFVAQNAVWVPMLASGVIIFLTLMHCLGQSQSGLIQVITTAFKYVSLLSFALAGIVYWLTGSHQGRVVAPGAVPQRVEIWSVIGSMVFIIYTYTGWNAASYIAGEVRNPERMLPRIFLAGCLATTVLYLAIVLAIAGVVPVVEIQSLKPSQLDTLATQVVSRVFPFERVPEIFSAIVSVGMLATVSAFLLSGSRVMSAMAAAGQFPAFAGRWHARRNIPILAVISMGTVSVLLTWFGGVRELIDYVGTGLTVLGILFASSIFIMRTRADYHPTFRVPFYPWPPILFLLAHFFILFAKGMVDVKGLLAGLGTVAIGVPAFFVVQWTGGLFSTGPKRDEEQTRHEAQSGNS